MPIIFKVGGGDSNLLSIDISVYSSLDSLPTNLPEGSIAILSNNTFSNFYIDTVAPTTPDDNDIWIYNGSYLPDIPFASEKIYPLNGINCAIYPIKIYQYMSTAWNPVEFKVFINNQWEYYVNPQSLNSWIFKMYAKVSLYPPIPSSFDGLTPTSTRTILDSSTSSSLNLGDNYSAIATSYVFFASNTTLSVSFITYDAGTVFINDVQAGSLPSNSWTSISCAFKYGWNKIEICYTENSGGDGFSTNPKLYNHASVVAMAGSI